MDYVFQFGAVWDHRAELIDGALLTLRISTCAFLIGLCLAGTLAYVRETGPAALRVAIGGYVQVMRNTPLLVQLFVLFFSLPAIGVRMDADDAALIGLSLNFAGYGAEILRGGMLAVPHGQVEAARALGLSRWRTFRHVVLLPSLQVAYPGLVSHFVLLMLGSSVISAISASDLTAITNTLQSTTFRSFEFYFAATGLYLAMALAARAVLGALCRFMFPPARRFA